MSKVFINDLRFKCSAIHHSVFYRRSAEKHTIVTVATDDMAITSKCTEDVAKFKSELKQHHQGHGEMHWFLGFQIKHDHAM